MVDGLSGAGGRGHFSINTFNFFSPPQPLFITKVNPAPRDSLIGRNSGGEHGHQDLQTFWDLQLLARANQQNPVILGEEVFDLPRSLTHIFLVIGHQGFRQGLHKFGLHDHHPSHGHEHPPCQMAPCPKQNSFQELVRQCVWLSNPRVD